MRTARASRAWSWVGALSFGLGCGALACLPHEETTPLGYVIAPSALPGDAGALLDASADAGDARYSSPVSKRDDRK